MQQTAKSDANQTPARRSPAEHLKPHWWKPGQSGNPKGRPKNARQKISDSFLRDALAVWEERGIQALRDTAETDPPAFCRVIAGLLPTNIKLEGELKRTFRVELVGVDDALPSTSQPAPAIEGELAPEPLPAPEEAAEALQEGLDGRRRRNGYAKT